MDDRNQGKGIQEIWDIIVCGALAAVGGLLAVSGAVLKNSDPAAVLAASGIGLLIMTVALSVYMNLARGGNNNKLEALLERQVDLLDKLSERSLLSDQAKRIAFRQKDRGALREAIIEDIRLEQYDEALAMVNDMGELYGQHEDAEQFRQEILEAQQKKRATMIDEAVKKIDDICTQRQWALAKQEAARLQRMYPEYPGISELDQRVELARERYKVDLISEFKEAHERQDTQRAKELLQIMDSYLSPEEAQPYLDMARDVLQSAKENLGVRFKMAVQDRDWISALSVGEQMMREYPTSTFANEVRGMLDMLKTKAEEQRASATGGTHTP